MLLFLLVWLVGFCFSWRRLRDRMHCQNKGFLPIDWWGRMFLIMGVSYDNQTNDKK